MDLRLLRSFVSVVEHGSLSEASRRCHISQPALSQQMQALEEQLGEPLLKRQPRGMEMTAAGEVLLGHARTLLAQADKLAEDFEGRRQLATGTVTFGIIPTIAPSLLPRILGPFRREHPGVTKAVVEAQTIDLIKKCVSGEIEFAILSDVTAEEKKRWSLVVRELFREPLLLATPVDHPLALRKSPPEAAEIEADELINLSGGHCLSERTFRLCRVRKPNPSLQCDQLATAVSMVAAGMGVTLVPKLAAHDQARPDVVYRPFAGDGVYRTITLMRLRKARLAPAAKELLKYIEQ